GGGAAFDDLGVARDLAQHEFLGRAVEELDVRKSQGAVKVETARGELRADTRDARVGVLNVVHRIFIAARFGKLEIKVEVLLVTAHQIEEPAGVVADLAAQPPQRDELS